MSEDLVRFRFSKNTSSIIKVAGIGGGGCNAVNNMYEAGIRDVDFLVCNTDAQALASSPVPVKIQLGTTLTEGRGAGNRPEMGEEAARENYEDIKKVLEENTKMLFITAGMGGGTGTGGAPVIARLASELGILTIAVVTIPSPAEGKKRYNQAIEGIMRLSEFTDSMLIVSNQKLHAIYGDLPARQAFKLADSIVTTAVKGVAEIITLHGNINIDFADVYTVMHNSKVFIMGTGYASGEGRAMKAVEMALQSPLLDNNDICGTKNILLNIISGTQEITIGEIGQIIEYLQNAAGQEADIIWGNGYDDSIGENISVTILCTGFRNAPSIEPAAPAKEERYPLQKEEAHPEAAAEPATDPALTRERKGPEGKPRVFELDLEPATHEEDNFPWSHETRKEEKPAAKKNTPPPRKKETKEKRSGSDNLDNWFYRKFGGLFDDDDQAV
jgi:cell division protein FtsZ